MAIRDDGERRLTVAWLRYGDTFVKVDGAWLFASASSTSAGPRPDPHMPSAKTLPKRSYDELGATETAAPLAGGPRDRLRIARGR